MHRVQRVLRTRCCCGSHQPPQIGSELSCAMSSSKLTSGEGDIVEGKPWQEFLRPSGRGHACDTSDLSGGLREEKPRARARRSSRGSGGRGGRDQRVAVGSHSRPLQTTRAANGKTRGSEAPSAGRVHKPGFHCSRPDRNATENPRKNKMDS